MVEVQEHEGGCDDLADLPRAEADVTERWAYHQQQERLRIHNTR
jgi:hypothetical protein